MAAGAPGDDDGDRDARRDALAVPAAGIYADIRDEGNDEADDRRDLCTWLTLQLLGGRTVGVDPASRVRAS